MTRLAVFDLDQTLLAGDSDYLWGRFLVERGQVNADEYERQNQAFYDQYRAGTLDIHEYTRFAVAPLAAIAREELLELRAAFVREQIAPIVAPLAPDLIERHRRAGDTLIITTATNRFVTEPIAAMLRVDALIATNPEILDGCYTGHISGSPNFREGKVLRLEQWLKQHDVAPTHITVYSDSHNDLPLLRRGDEAIAVDPDPLLRDEAERRGWPIISLRTEIARA